MNVAEAEVLPVGRGTAPAWEVTAVRYGTLSSRRRDLFHHYELYGEPDAEAEMAYYFWVLERDGEHHLVDAGFDPAVGRRRGRTPIVGQREALEALGVSPDSIRSVIVTHLHYDHIGGLDLFPQAELIVPERELDFWTGPIARRAAYAAHVEPDEIAYLEEAVAAGRVRTTPGDEEVLPGVWTIPVGGHSPGLQMVLVEAPPRPVLLASDAIHFYEELEADRPFRVVSDLEAMYRAYDLIRRLSADRDALVVPGHDPAVVERHDRAGGVPYAVSLGGSP